MTREIAQPYYAGKLDGRWRVKDYKNQPVVTCDCRCDAEWLALQLNEAEHHARIAAMISLLSRGPVLKTFISPDDEFYQ